MCMIIGLIPRVCEDIFVRMQNNKEPRLTYACEVSFMEIYNETVKDLLNPKNNKKVNTNNYNKITIIYI